ncbi:MAG: epoxyqueuosine reductase QueH [Mycoplasmatota bacterium]|nr:epoxyqueuosine reductase QueH [Mycoplasmatota bacterium]
MEKTSAKLCLEELKNITPNKSILLHSCCAPCSSYVITFLAPYFNITILYYNPNIFPKNEYLKRKEEQIRLINSLKTPNKVDILDCDYDNEIYEKQIKGYENCPERGARCTICFKLRLEKTAELAKKNNYDYFCSTLTVSPYKNAKLINEIGNELAKKYQIKWLYSDFKKNDGYKKSIELSKKYNLYRQNYCGCIYSKKEQEEKNTIKIA